METVIFAVVAVACVAVLIRPRLGWRWTFRRWQYRNPDAVEPSDDYLAVIRIAAGFVLAVSLGFLWFSGRDLLDEARLPEDTAVAEAGFDRVSGERVLLLAPVDGEEFGILGVSGRDGASPGLVLAVPPCYGEPVVATEEDHSITQTWVLVDVGVRYLGGDACDSDGEVTEVSLDREALDDAVVQTGERDTIPSCSSARCD